jgi:hypothetical protein
MMKHFSISLVALLSIVSINCSDLSIAPSANDSPSGSSSPTSSVQALAVTYNVGPTRTYKTLQDVATLVAPGDLVLVDGDATYPGGAVFSNSGTASGRITIRGVVVNGKRPIINGGPKNGIEIDAADYYTIETLEITGAPKAGLGIFGDQVEIRDVVIHDCVNGMMGWGQHTGSVLMEYCEIYRCGREASGGMAAAHGIYMATDELAHPGAIFRLQFCYIHDGTGGNNVKTRAERNEIYYNWIEGATHHGMELVGPDPADNRKVKPDLKREDSDVVGNVIIVTTAGSGARVGGDGTGYTNGRYRFVNNTFILNGSSDGVRTYSRLQTIEMHNNAFYNKQAASGTQVIDDATVNWANGRQVKGSNNWIQTGTNSIPVEFTATIFGTSPGFADLSTNNVMLTSGSPLINVGNPAPVTFATYSFPNPLFPPAYQPPLHTLLPVGTASFRPANGTIDIGAYEF